MQGTVERGVYGAHTKILDIQGGFKAVIYQDTAVVKFNETQIILTAPEASKTQTTKLRMNQASYQYDLGYIVVKKRGKWYIHHSYKNEEGKFRAAGKIDDFVGTNYVIYR